MDAFGANLDLPQLHVDFPQPLGGDLHEFLLFVGCDVLSEVGQIQDDLIEQLGDLLLLVLEVVAQVPEVPILVISTLYQLRQYDRDVRTSQLVVLLVDEFLHHHLLVGTEDDVVELEQVDGLIDLVVQFLQFLLRQDVF